MDRFEAIDFAAKAKGHYPRMTDEQVGALKSHIEPFSRDVAGEALRQFVAEVSDWSLPRFVAVAKRIQAEKGAEERNRETHQRMAEDQQIQSHWQYVATLGAELTDDEVADGKAKALAKLNRPLQDFYAARDPRKTRSLMELVLRALNVPIGGNHAS